jgi:FO synthase
MHAVLRLTVGRVIPNVQASWVKLGRRGALEMLAAGVNDLGGVLMNESITRAAGAAHGQMWIPKDIEQAIVDAGRSPVQRNTRYEPVASQAAGQLSSDAIKWVSHTPAGRYANPKYRSAI